MDYSKLNIGDVIDITGNFGEKYEVEVVSMHMSLGLVYVKDNMYEYVINCMHDTMRLLHELVEDN